MIDRKRLGWATALVLALAALGMSAHAAIRAIVAHRSHPSALRAAALHPTFVAAPVALAPVVAARTPEAFAATSGVTGTVTPPAPPPGAALVPSPIVQAVAKPFSTVGASALDRGRAIECLTAALYYEAASESDDGQRAVAQVILNRVRHPAFPNSVCGVVYQGSEHGGCQFSFACDGSMARLMPARQRARSASIAAAALAGHVFAPVGLATHYHTFAVTPAWNRALVMTDALGAHFFHRWKGYWGTPAAFTQRYGGNEPVPGPRLPPAALPTPTLPLVATPLAPLVLAPAPAAPAQSPQIETGMPVAATARLPQSTALERWKDTGTPLR